MFHIQAALSPSSAPSSHHEPAHTASASKSGSRLPALPHKTQRKQALRPIPSPSFPVLLLCGDGQWYHSPQKRSPPHNLQSCPGSPRTSSSTRAQQSPGISAVKPHKDRHLPSRLLPMPLAPFSHLSRDKRLFSWRSLP